MSAHSRYMRFGVLLAVACFLSSSNSAKAQSSHPISLGADYAYVHTNILPGCNCVSLQGGSAQLEFGLSPHLAALAEFTAAHRSGITPDGYTLTQLTYTFGLRYIPLSDRRFSPFGEVLFGGAHALGSLSPGNNAIGGTSNAVAFQPGGGVALRIGKRVRLVPVRADYLLTNFRNNADNHQNDVRFSAGILFMLRP